MAANSSSALKKINIYKDTYILFYSPNCPYGRKALSLLKNSTFKWKSYNIETIDGGLMALLDVLNKNHMLDEYNKKYFTNHKSQPLIFYNKKFIGGASDLEKVLAE